MLKEAIEFLRSDLQCALLQDIPEGNVAVLNQHIFSSFEIRHWIQKPNGTNPLNNVRCRHHNVWSHPSIEQAFRVIRNWLATEQSMDAVTRDIFYKFALYHHKVEKQFPKTFKELHTDDNENIQMIESLINTIKCPISNTFPIDNAVIFKGRVYERSHIMKRLVDSSFSNVEYPRQTHSLKDLTYTDDFRQVLQRANELIQAHYTGIEQNRRAEHIRSSAPEELLLMAKNCVDHRLYEGSVCSMLLHQEHEVKQAYNSLMSARLEYNRCFGDMLDLSRFSHPIHNQEIQSSSDSSISSAEGISISSDGRISHDNQSIETQVIPNLEGHPLETIVTNQPQNLDSNNNNNNQVDPMPPRIANNTNNPQPGDNDNHNENVTPPKHRIPENMRNDPESRRIFQSILIEAKSEGWECIVNRQRNPWFERKHEQWFSRNGIMGK